MWKVHVFLLWGNVKDGSDVAGLISGVAVRVQVLRLW